MVQTIRKKKTLLDTQQLRVDKSNIILNVCQTGKMDCILRGILALHNDSIYISVLSLYVVFDDVGHIQGHKNS